MRVVTGTLRDRHDVVVAGSGASGLTAALVAARAGADVLVIEKTGHLGGTSALSGGMLWIPGNGLPGAPDPEADRRAARRYLEILTLGRAEERLLDAHLERVPDLLALTASIGLDFDVVGAFPDYKSMLDGAADGGRAVEPALYPSSELGDLAAFLRPDPRLPFRQLEYFEQWRTYRNIPVAELTARAADGIVARGRALVSPLLRALVDAGATLVVDGPLERLLVADDGIRGVVAGGRPIEARSGTVLACGGFEWNDEMIARFLSGPIQTRCSLPANVGDGHRAAMAAGVDLAGMNEAWWGVMADMPGVEADGTSVGTILTVERALPGSIVVNRAGRRFINEAGSYYDIGKVFATFDPHGYGYANLPAFLIADARFVERHGILGVDRLDELPACLANADTPAELAVRIGVDPDGLTATLDRFNDHARAGRDPDFHRGESTYDRYFGDPDAVHPNLAPLEQGPYVALELRCGAIGTKGGVRTDDHGRALTPFGEALPGLFAVGNNAAHAIAFGYAGAGSTLGPGMTMAMAAGHALAGAPAPA